MGDFGLIVANVAVQVAVAVPGKSRRDAHPN
jgi:hypothetical protein